MAIKANENIGTGIAVVALLFAIIALAVDQLATVDVANCDYDYCGWKESRIKCYGVSASADYSCSSDDSSCNAVKSAGQAWMAFGIIGVFFFTIPIVLSLAVHQHRKYSRFLYAIGAISFLVSFIIWVSDGCSAKYSSWDLGASAYLMVIAGILGIVAVIMEWRTSPPENYEKM